MAVVVPNVEFPSNKVEIDLDPMLEKLGRLEMESVDSGPDSAVCDDIQLQEREYLPSEGGCLPEYGGENQGTDHPQGSSSSVRFAAGRMLIGAPRACSRTSSAHVSRYGHRLGVRWC